MSSSTSTSIKILSGTRLEHCNVISIIDSIKSKAHRAETHIIKRCLGFELLQQVPHNSRLGGCCYCPSIRLRGADVSYLSLIYIVMTESSLCRISTPLFLQSTHIAWIQVNSSLIRIKGKSRVYVTPPQLLFYNWNPTNTTDRTYSPNETKKLQNDPKKCCRPLLNNKRPTTLSHIVDKSLHNIMTCGV